MFVKYCALFSSILLLCCGEVFAVEQKCSATSQLEGSFPYHVYAGTHNDLTKSVYPDILDKDKILVIGKVLSLDCKPISSAKVKVWQTSGDIETKKQSLPIMSGSNTSNNLGDFMFITAPAHDEPIQMKFAVMHHVYNKLFARVFLDDKHKILADDARVPEYLSNLGYKNIYYVELVLSENNKRIRY